MVLVGLSSTPPLCSLSAVLSTPPSGCCGNVKQQRRSLSWDVRSMPAAAGAMADDGVGSAAELPAVSGGVWRGRRLQWWWWLRRRRRRASCGLPEYYSPTARPHEWASDDRAVRQPAQGGQSTMFDAATRPPLSSRDAGDVDAIISESLHALFDREDSTSRSSLPPPSS
ncbi:unnamed protein product, partial [Ectocarpus sp. 12 AP-2014]